MLLRSARQVGALIGLLAAIGSSAQAQEVLLTRDQALKEIFPAVARTSEETRTIPASLHATLEHELGREIVEEQLAVTRVYSAANALLGYAVVTEEIGKYRPITFMVGVTPDIRIRDVAVMVYRESRGGDVKRRRFLNQYRGKSVRDPIDVNRDIINISGATISVRALNAGVKRVLAELTALYGSPTAR